MSTATMLVPMNGDGHNHGNAIQTSREYSQVSGVQRVTDAMEMMRSIRTFVLNELVPGHDFGTIPGAGDRKVLLQPGGQKILAFFESFGEQRVERSELGGGHVEFVVTTSVVRYATGQRIGLGLGSCSTMESKYRFRNGKLSCPKCGKETVNRSKDGDGYYCWAKVGGCGATFAKGDKAITGQVVGKVENDNPHDVRNTVLKMACKRSLVAAALSLGCASDLFTQDLDDTYDLNAAPSPPIQDAPAPASAPAQTKSSPGTAFVAFLGDESRRVGRDLVKSASSYGQRKQYPANLHDWTEEQASACWGWIERGLAKKADEAAAKQAPAPASTAESQRDESKAEIEKAYQPGPARARFEGWLMEALTDANKRWKASEARIKAGLPDQPLVDSMYQLSNHLGKWAERRPHVGYVRPEPFKPGPVIERLAPLWEKHFDDFAGELVRYLEKTLPDRVLAEAQDEPGANG